MAITPRQSSPITVVSANASSVSATLPAAPIAGNKLAFLVIVDKNALAFTPPAGFTQRRALNASSISLLLCEKTSDGSESGAVTATWTGTVTRPKAQLIELQASGTIAYDTSNSNNTETAVTTLSSGSVTTGANANFGIVVFGNDSAKAAPTDPDPVPTFDQGFSVHSQDWFATGGIGEPGFVVGVGSVPASTTLAVTVTLASATADQMAGAIIVFSETGGDSTAPSFSVAPAVVPTSTGGNVSATINESGSIFYVVVANNATAPSSAQVVAGQNGSGGAPLASGSATATTTINSGFSGLTASTDYDLYIVARDTADNLQASPTKVDFATSASPPVGNGALIIGFKNSRIIS